MYAVAEIEAIVRLHKERLEQGLDPVTGYDPNSPTLDEFVQGDFRSYALQKYKDMRDRDNRYKNWIQPHFGHIKIVELKKADIVRFHTWAKEQRSAVTANRNLSQMSGYMTYAVDLELIEKNPCQGIRKFPEGGGRDRMLSDSESLRVMRSLVKRLGSQSGKAIFLLLVTGKRKTEILSAKWSNFDIKARTLRLLDTKNGTSETLVLNTQAYDLLVRMEKERDRSSDWIFPSSRSKSGRLREVRRTFASILKESSVTDFRLHDCRHQFGSWLINAGIPLADIQKLLNHKDLRSTMIYARLAKNKLAESSEIVSDKVTEVLARV